MKKRKRYQLTEGQLKTVIKVIPENYPAGVTDANFDRLSGYDRDTYETITDVEYNSGDGDITFYVESEHGQSFSKKIWSGDDNFINMLQRYLGDKYPLQEGWDIKKAHVDKGSVVFEVYLGDEDNRTVIVPIDGESIIEILPEMESGEEHSYQNDEPDFETYGNDY
jgi:hypothetical protein